MVRFTGKRSRRRVAAGHFRRSVAELLLDVAFVDLGRRGQAGAQRVPGRLLLPLACGKIAAHACREREALDQARDVAVVTCSDPTSRPTAARNTGPRAMRANFSRASTAATGQVRSVEPRPISTSRQSVLPRKVRSAPSSKNSGQPLASATGRMMATMLAGISEFERDLLRERVRSGLAAAKARGKLLGRQPGQRPKSDRLAPKVLALVDAGRSYRLIGRELGLSKNTVGDIVKRRRALNAGSSVP